MAKKKTDNTAAGRNIAGYSFPCPCLYSQEPGRNLCLLGAPMCAPSDESPGIGFWGWGSLQAGEAVWSLDLEDYPKEVGTLRDTEPWYPQWGPGGDSKGMSRWGPEQAEQGVLDLGSIGDTRGTCLVLGEHRTFSRG